MQGTTWFPAALLGLCATAIILLLLLLRAQKLLRAARARARAATNPEVGFSEDQEYRLLAKQELFVAGTVHDFGVVETGPATIRPYLVGINMRHIQVGDRFCFRNHATYKLDVRSPSSASRPAPFPDPQLPEASSRASAEPGTWQGLALEKDVPDVAPVAAPVPEPVPATGQSDDRTLMYPADDAAAAAAQLNGLTYLQVTEGPDTGIRFPLDYADASIGRSESNTIMLSDEGASRQHCKILYQAPHFVLTDAQSTNGTLCNNELVEVHTLEFGDLVQVADSTMLFTCRGHELKEADPAAAIAAFECCLSIEPDFLLALKNLAFLLERDLRRKKEADPLWKKIAQLEKTA